MRHGADEQGRRIVERRRKGREGRRQGEIGRGDRRGGREGGRQGETKKECRW